MPIYAQEKVIALSDISIYTSDGDTPLIDVLRAISKKEEGKKISLDPKSPNNELFAYLEEVLPNYSRESVYASDVKKIISWYNMLTEHGIDFEEEKEEEEEQKEQEEQEEQEEQKE